MNNQNKPTELSHLDYLLTNNAALQQYYVDCLYGELAEDTNTLFLNWLKQHPNFYNEFKEIRATKDLLQLKENTSTEGMILPTFYQQKTPSKTWLRRIGPVLKWAAILLLFFGGAKVFDLQLSWQNNALTFHLGEVTSQNGLMSTEGITNLINKELSTQLPVFSSAIQSVIKDEFSQALISQNERYEQLLLTTLANQEVVYQAMFQQISEEISTQRRNDLFQIMQELDNTKTLSSREIAKNREVLNGLMEYAGVSLSEQTRTFNEE